MQKMINEKSEKKGKKEERREKRRKTKWKEMKTKGNNEKKYKKKIKRAGPVPLEAVRFRAGQGNPGEKKCKQQK